MENQFTFYRARFRVVPYSTRDEAAPWVLQTIYNWLVWKETNRRTKELHYLGTLLEDSCINLKECSDGLENAYYYSQKLAEGMQCPAEYHGGSYRKMRTCLCSRAIVDNGSPLVPEAWAMDYDEPDGRQNLRRWHTSVGYVSDATDGSCIVNVRIFNYMLPGYIGDTPGQPSTNVPRFVRDLIRPPYGSSPFQVCVGETVMAPYATKVTWENIDTVFTDDLLSRDRKAPMVLVSSNRDGEFPVDPEEIAEKLIGTANVFSIDASDRGTTAAYGRRYGSRGDLDRYAVQVNQVRVYQPGVNPSRPGDVKRHRFFGLDDMQGRNDFTDMIARSIMRNWSREQSGVVDVTDVEARESKRRNEDLRRRLDELVRQREAQAPAAQAEDLAEALERIAKLEEDVNVWQALATEFEGAMGEADTARSDSLEAQVAELSGRIEELSDEVEIAGYDLDKKDGDIKRLEHEKSEAYAQRAKAQSDLARERAANEALRSIDSVPRNARDLLEVVSKVNSDKIVVLSSALESAEKYKGKTSLDEMLEMLKSLSTVLWPALFGDDASGNVAVDYEARANFGLAMGESKLTKNNAELMRLRTFDYRGKPTDFSAHIKGREKRPKDTLRLHFAPDTERELVVVGYFGHHLKTAGTQKIH